MGEENENGDMRRDLDEGGEYTCRSGRYDSALQVQPQSALVDDSLWASHVLYCTSFSVRFPI